MVASCSFMPHCCVRHTLSFQKGLSLQPRDLSAGVEAEDTWSRPAGAWGQPEEVADEVSGRCAAALTAPRAARRKMVPGMEPFAWAGTSLPGPGGVGLGPSASRMYGPLHPTASLLEAEGVDH